MIFKLTEEMANSINQKLKFQLFIDRIVKYFVPSILFISILTFFIWSVIKYFFNSKISWIYISERSISILVVSCPCAFGLAIPIVTTTSLKIALQYGILVKNLAVLPEIKDTKKVVFDKTGTLTEVITDINLEYNSNEFPILHFVELLEKNQLHPVAESLYKYSIRKKKLEENLFFKEIPVEQILTIKSLDKNELDNYKELYKNNQIIEECNGIMRHNNGITSKVIYNNKELNVHIGNDQFIFSLGILNVNEIEDVNKLIKDLNDNKLMLILIVINNKLSGIFTLNTFSNLRAEAKGVISALNEKNIESYILSGDTEVSVRESGKILNLPEKNLFGYKSAQSKKLVLNDLKNKDQTKVMMIGDGINDCLSLTEASFGISFNANSQLNMISSDIIFLQEDLSLILVLLKISKYTYFFIWLNVFWAFAYNFIMIPFTSGFLNHYINYNISPSMSSLAQLISDIFIVCTASLLRCFKFNEFKADNSLKTRDEINTLNGNLLRKKSIDNFSNYSDSSYQENLLIKNSDKENINEIEMIQPLLLTVRD